jgi:hypothetical protein
MMLAEAAAVVADEEVAHIEILRDLRKKVRITRTTAASSGVWKVVEDA